jgi:predicted ATP-grasp superfamily ATP-dependent carboligase
MENSIDILIPASDYDVETLMRLIHQGWQPKVKMFHPPYEAYEVLADKGKLAERTKQLGFCVPQVYTQLDQIQYPLIIKPARESGSKGVFVVKEKEEFVSALTAVKRMYGNEVVLQEYIPGGTGSIHMCVLLYGEDARVYGEVVGRSLLTFKTWGGGGNAGTIADEPELINQAKEIIASCGGWRGPICLEFKKHSSTGKFYLMEANCRLNGYSYLFTMNGLNFPAAVIDLLTKKATPYLSFSHKQQLKKFVLGFREKLVSEWV